MKRFTLLIVLVLVLVSQSFATQKTLYACLMPEQPAATMLTDTTLALMATSWQSKVLDLHKNYPAAKYVLGVATTGVALNDTVTILTRGTIDGLTWVVLDSQEISAGATGGAIVQGYSFTDTTGSGMQRLRYPYVQVIVKIECTTGGAATRWQPFVPWLLGFDGVGNFTPWHAIGPQNGKSIQMRFREPT